MAHLLRDIERHLRSTGTKPTAFGRDTVKDPRFVFDLRNGREVREKTEQRVRSYLEGIGG
jgi:2,4-dienoyl-CoA reductase-like NADH-dependent reductase (Old Yellow Enzyme family)